MTNKKSLLYHKKVGIYLVIENHYSLLNVILNSLKFFHCKITLFISEELARKYPVGGDIVSIEWVSPVSRVPDGTIHKMNRQDLMIFDELTSFRELLRFSNVNIIPPRIQIIHDCNSWMKPVVPRSLKNYLRYQFTRKLKQKCKVFAVAGANMKRYIEQYFPSVPVYLIPFRYADFDPEKDIPLEYKPGEKLRVCIPGTISPRRNYKRMLAALYHPALKEKLFLDVLGKPIGDYGSGILKDLQNLRSRGYSISFNGGYVENRTFEQSVRAAHILLSDFETSYITNNGQKEIYGITKETGITSLMLNKGKVGLLPDDFNQMEEIKDQTLFFKNREDLTRILLSITSNKISLRDLQQKAVKNAQKMNMEDISNEILKAYTIQLDESR